MVAVVVEVAAVVVVAIVGAAVVILVVGAAFSFPRLLATSCTEFASD